jgi:pimeloyl-ACP methyl ester carboxylesterase
VAVQVEQQRARLVAAEARTFDHYGIAASSEPLRLDHPATMTRVVRSGQGVPTVVLHGASMTSTVWAPLVPHLPGLALHLVDLPGCGLADPFDYTGVDLPAHQAAFVGSVLDALGLEHAALVGASLGGMFALRFALEHPSRVTRLVMVTAPAFALPGARLPRSMAILGGRRVGRVVAAIAPAPSARTMRRVLESVGGRGSTGDEPDALYDALGAAMALAGPTNLSASAELFRWRTPLPHNQVTDDELATCGVPTLWIWGEDDKVQRPEAGVRAAQVMRDARIEVLPGGHGIWFEEPSWCGRLVTGFVTDACR